MIALPHINVLAGLHASTCVLVFGNRDLEIRSLGRGPGWLKYGCDIFPCLVYLCLHYCNININHVWSPSSRMANAFMPKTGKRFWMSKHSALYSLL